LIFERHTLEAAYLFDHFHEVVFCGVLHFGVMILSVKHSVVYYVVFAKGNFNSPTALRTRERLRFTHGFHSTFAQNIHLPTIGGFYVATECQAENN
jgi:hypothetical protein